MTKRIKSNLTSLILAILWAVAQFLLLDKIAIAVGADSILTAFNGMTLYQNVENLFESLGIPVDLFNVPVNIYSAVTIFSLVVIAIIINFVTGFLQLAGVDAVLTTIFNGLFGPTALSNITYYSNFIVTFLQPGGILETINSLISGLASGGSGSPFALTSAPFFLGAFPITSTSSQTPDCVSQSYESQSSIFSESSNVHADYHHHHSKRHSNRHSKHNCSFCYTHKNKNPNLSQNIIIILEVLGILNIVKLVLALNAGSYSDAQNILVSGILTGKNIDLVNIPTPKSLLLPCSVYSSISQSPEPTVLGLIRSMLLVIITNFYFFTYSATALPIPPLPV